MAVINPLIHILHKNREGVKGPISPHYPERRTNEKNCVQAIWTNTETGRTQYTD